MKNKADKSTRNSIIWLTLAYLVVLTVSSIWLETQPLSLGWRGAAYLIISLSFLALYARILFASARRSEEAGSERLEAFGRQAIIEVEKEVDDKKFLTNLDKEIWG